jgi:UDP-GlcNAc:undecaprenyl-phosphate/decaprenyl-phosphate GlcNAc-1-phosphate transferase
MSTLILSFITAFVLTFLAIPAIILVAITRKLFDKPNERSSHEYPTPSLGGIGIFGGVICAIIMWVPEVHFGQFQYLFAAFLLIFLIGIRDDLLPLSPTKKFVTQLLAAVILVVKARIMITHMWGIGGIGELPEGFAIVLSVMAIVGVINAFNLIDGINGLAASLALLACCTFGAWFFLANHLAWSVVAFSMAGSLIAFLKYNLTPARIFMGDTGSLFVGMVCIVLAIKFSELNLLLPFGTRWHCASAPVVALSALLIPIYDTVRVFLRRMSQGKSPFHADKTHIHHMLIGLGMSHTQATSLLVAMSLLCISLALLLGHIGPNWLIIIELGVVMLFNFVLAHMVQKKNISAVA